MTTKDRKSLFKMPPIVFGGNVFGWTADKKMSFYLLDALLERGLNVIDTANVYSYWGEGNSGGESETVIGQWLHERKNRDQVIIATKVGSPIGDESNNLSAAYIKEQIDLSLKRLQTDYVDIYFSHKYDESVTQRETLAAYKHLINAGKVREIGASNFPLAVLRDAIELSKAEDLPKYNYVQPQYNLMEREGFEGDYQRLCIEENLKVISYFTLASGFLTGKYQSVEETSGKARERFVKKYFTAKGNRVLNTLTTLSKKYNCSEAAIAIAWTIAQPGITAPIVSATKIAHLEAFDQALKLNLDQEAIDLLKDASA